MSSVTALPPPSTVAELIERRADDGNVGLMAGARRWTWREVVDSSRCYAATVRRLGASVPGAPNAPLHVGVLMDNTPEHVFALFGTALAGGATVGLNTTRRVKSLRRDIVHTDCSLVLTDRTHAPLLDGLDLHSTPVRLVDDPAWLVELDATNPTDRMPAPPDAGDAFMLIFTSGSTAAPKAVIMSHGRAAGSAVGSTWFSPTTSSTARCRCSTGNALNAIVFPALATGAAIALRDRFSASEFIHDLRHYRATFFTSVGRAIGHILATPPDDPDQVHSVKYALGTRVVAARRAASSGAASVSPASRGTGRARTPSSWSRPTGCRPIALGRPQEGIEAAIVDPRDVAARARSRPSMATGS